jgi:hypothetical protein
MRSCSALVLGACTALAACAGSQRVTTESAVVSTVAAPSGSLAQIYYWRARPGKFDEYTRYVRDVAQPIDHEAQRRGAFLSVTTYVSRDTTTPWTHMRVFILRDSVQLSALGGALDSAGMRLEPDSVKRRVRGEYSATLRDRVGAATVSILR